MERKMIGVEVTGGELAPRLRAIYEERPVVAVQQPARKVDAFRNMFAILHNFDRWELEEAGVIANRDWHGNKQWDRFNNDLTTFVLKLDDARLDALYALVQSRQPERYRDAVARSV